MHGSTVIEPTTVELSDRFAALADATRLRILEVLADGPRCVCDLREDVPVAPNLLSYHLKVLREAGLVRAARRGRWIDYALDEDALAHLRAAVPTPSAVPAGAACCTVEVAR